MTAARQARAALARYAPIVDWLPNYRIAWLGRDAVAGLAVAAVAIPTAMGYSVVALVPVQVGLYALPAALILYAVFGSSRQLAIGPTSTVALMSGAVVAGIFGHGDPQQAIALSAGVALSAGLWLALFGLLKLGWVTAFISRPVIVGFSFGLSLTVIVSELPHLLGVPVSDVHVAQRIWQTLAELGEANPATIAVGVVGLVILFVGQVRWPLVPWALILMGMGVVMARSGLPTEHNMEVIGAVPPGLPAFSLPAVSWSDLEPLILGGLAVAVAAVAEGLSAARIFASKGGYRIDADSEFLATGMANVGAGLTGGMGVCGSLSRTGTAETSGARSQVSGLFTALAVVVFLLTMTGLLEGVPRVLLSCVIVVSVFFLLDVQTLLAYRRLRRNDFTSALAGLSGVLLFGPLYGLLIAVGMSLLGLTYRASRVRIDPLGKVPGEKAGWAALEGHPERETVPGVLVLRLDAPLFWANCESSHAHILEQVEQADVRALVLDLEATSQMDATTLSELTDLLRELRARDVELFIARLHFAAREVLDRSGFSGELGRGHVWHSISQTVKAAKHHVSGRPLPEQPDAIEATESDGDAPD